MRVLVVLVALAVTGSAPAAPPEGFRESTRLTVRAAEIAGAPTVVHCARNLSAWRELVTVNGWNVAGRLPHGMTDYDTGFIYLPPYRCVPMENHLRGRKVWLPTLGASILTLTHEALHVRGMRDEYETECEAEFLAEDVARRWFGIRKAKTLRRVMLGVERASFCR